MDVVDDVSMSFYLICKLVVKCRGFVFSMSGPQTSDDSRFSLIYYYTHTNECSYNDVLT